MTTILEYIYDLVLFFAELWDYCREAIGIDTMADDNVNYLYRLANWIFLNTDIYDDMEFDVSITDERGNEIDYGYFMHSGVVTIYKRDVATNIRWHVMVIEDQDILGEFNDTIAKYDYDHDILSVQLMLFLDRHHEGSI